MRRELSVKALLSELPETQRADAVNSLVYEANARIRDPIYGSAGVITNLHEQMTKLQAEVSLAQAEISNLQCQNSNLMALISKQHSPFQDSTLLPYDDHGATSWDSFWS
ncbi:hypothetical protein RND71_002103 [Anisodus tanguticus]|uniref:LOB domain-containing protein n=1 Tax=Anisodus tanguticus TaxID=243964 RepID=A0AAE1T3G1_9SOLA|nr:hypothetical protein RND71_002103 [Anisodus tanguticus]